MTLEQRERLDRMITDNGSSWDLSRSDLAMLIACRAELSDYKESIPVVIAAVNLVNEWRRIGGHPGSGLDYALWKAVNKMQGEETL